MARRETDCNVRNALDFALLEDFDHLYRYSNLLDLEYGTDPKKLVGGYTEIMPGRPTISEHRWPKDSIFKYISNPAASMLTKLHVNIITAAEQQTMNYYMNVAPAYCKSDIGRRMLGNANNADDISVNMKASKTPGLPGLKIYSCTNILNVTSTTPVCRPSVICISAGFGKNALFRKFPTCIRRPGCFVNMSTKNGSRSFPAVTSRRFLFSVPTLIMSVKF